MKIIEMFKQGYLIIDKMTAELVDIFNAEGITWSSGVKIIEASINRINLHYEDFGMYHSAKAEYAFPAEAFIKIYKEEQIHPILRAINEVQGANIQEGENFNVGNSVYNPFKFESGELLDRTGATRCNKLGGILYVDVKINPIEKIQKTKLTMNEIADKFGIDVRGLTVERG